MKVALNSCCCTQMQPSYILCTSDNHIDLLGGNAGMAAALVARKMGVPATIVIPSSSPELVVQRLQDQGATVKISGKVIKHICSCLWSQICQFESLSSA